MVGGRATRAVGKDLHGGGTEAQGERMNNTSVVPCLSRGGGGGQATSSSASIQHQPALTKAERWSVLRPHMRTNTYTHIHMPPCAKTSMSRT